MCGKKKPGTENKDTRIVGGLEAEVCSTLFEIFFFSLILNLKKIY